MLITMLLITVHNLIVSLFFSILLKVPHGSAGDELKGSLSSIKGNPLKLAATAHVDDLKCIGKEQAATQMIQVI